nr:hypothetical protein [Tanacetum cinerariifolium]
MIFESVENGPLIWPSIEDNGVTYPKKYSELSTTKATQADCDVKATNIILQGLPPEYTTALILHHHQSLKLHILQQQQTEFPTLDSCLTVLVFKQGDDLIGAINHMMSFLSAIVTSRYLTINNKLRNSSNPRKQASINYGKITLQLVQGRQTSFATGTSRTYTPGASGSNSGKQRTVTCYNCKG